MIDASMALPGGRPLGYADLGPAGAPVRVMHGEADTVVPVAADLTRALR